jgi:hypothetical protein
MMSFNNAPRHGSGGPPNTPNFSSSSGVLPLSGVTTAASSTTTTEQLINQTWGILRRKGGVCKETDKEIHLNYRIVHNVKDSYTLGRSRTCDIHVDHRCVSSRHCTIYCDYTQARMRVFVEDHSVNGTFINDSLTKISKGERMELRSGDEIYLINPKTAATTSSGGNTPNVVEGNPRGGAGGQQQQQQAQSSITAQEDLNTASFIFVNIRDRIAANREITVAPPKHQYPYQNQHQGGTVPLSVPPVPNTHSNILGQNIHTFNPNSVLSTTANTPSVIERHIDDYYLIGDKIGSGMSGQVYFCINRFTKQRCAVKEIDLRKVHMTPGLVVEDLKEEAKLMQQLKHVSEN